MMHERRAKWGETLSLPQVIGLLVGALAYSGLLYLLGHYIYPSCGIPLSTNTVVERRIPLYVLLGLFFVACILIGRIRWFADRDRWLVSVSVIASVVSAIILLSFSCSRA